MTQEEWQDREDQIDNRISALAIKLSKKRGRWSDPIPDDDDEDDKPKDETQRSCDEDERCQDCDDPECKVKRCEDCDNPDCKRKAS